ncbi:GNAT family N-acetyltransferase [Streptomyces sp. Act143]|uniref:GNAT family N-acetyltransferase n=1 Tax=Streptomyces sp. Act143 TaxID=2200760 RepID=UPI000D680FB5|nr:GNAT family N-acetyltransferase [Streptomyces sp. Act143]PWI16495.1 GNAT family N-acetyltransferase [Streptomyces sp. Act143]
MNFEVRPIRADEWPAVKALRLRSLKDPAAPVAFLDTHEAASARPDSFWQERAAGSSDVSGAGGALQFVAEAADGTWVGSVVMLIEEAGTTDWAGFPVERRQGHVVGVFVLPEWRGGPVTKALFDAALEWAWGRGVEAVRLIVHEDNPRAQGFYRKAGFVPSGKVVPLEGREEEKELEFVLGKPA